jgi:hypothetical protein
MAFVYELQSNGASLGFFSNKYNLLIAVDYGIDGDLKCLRHEEPRLERERRVSPTSGLDQDRWRYIFYKPIEVPLTEKKVYAKSEILSYSEWSDWRG